MKNELTQHIQSLILNHKSNGKHLYFPKTDMTISAGDESSITNLIYEGNIDYDSDLETVNNESELLIELEKQILNTDPNTLGTGQEFSIKYEQGQTIHWVSTAGDYLHIQITDMNLYITLFFSGQY